MTNSKRIYDGVKYNDKLRVCFDTCHTSDSGLDIVGDFEGVMDSFDKAVGKEQIAVFHINDSKIPGVRRKTDMKILASERLVSMH